MGLCLNRKRSAETFSDNFKLQTYRSKWELPVASMIDMQRIALQHDRGGEGTVDSNFLEGRGYRTSYSSSSVSIVTRLGWTTEKSLFCSRQKQETSLFD
jgi:hypothetical protein